MKDLATGATVRHSLFTSTLLYSYLSAICDVSSEVDLLGQKDIDAVTSPISGGTNDKH